MVSGSPCQALPLGSVSPGGPSTEAVPSSSSAPRLPRGIHLPECGVSEHTPGEVRGEWRSLDGRGTPSGPSSWEILIEQLLGPWPGWLCGQDLCALPHLSCGFLGSVPSFPFFLSALPRCFTLTGEVSVLSHGDLNLTLAQCLWLFFSS